MARDKEPKMEIESLSDADLESVSGGYTHTTGGTCNTSTGICDTAVGATCNTSGSGTCNNVPAEGPLPEGGGQS
jgi:hypothetical protein